MRWENDIRRKLFLKLLNGLTYGQEVHRGSVEYMLVIIVNGNIDMVLKVKDAEIVDI